MKRASFSVQSFYNEMIVKTGTWRRCSQRSNLSQGFGQFADGRLSPGDGRVRLEQVVEEGDHLGRELVGDLAAQERSP